MGKLAGFTVHRNQTWRFSFNGKREQGMMQEAKNFIFDNCYDKHIIFVAVLNEKDAIIYLINVIHNWMW